MNELALFAGSGGGILAGHLLGWRTICAVEIDAYCRRVLFARQRDRTSQIGNLGKMRLVGESNTMPEPKQTNELPEV